MGGAKNSQNLTTWFMDDPREILHGTTLLLTVKIFCKARTNAKKAIEEWLFRKWVRRVLVSFFAEILN